MIDIWQQGRVESNSVCRHTSDEIFLKTTNTFSTDISGKGNVKKENITPFLKFTSFLFPG